MCVHVNDVNPDAKLLTVSLWTERRHFQVVVSTPKGVVAVSFDKVILDTAKTKYLTFLTSLPSACVTCERGQQEQSTFLLYADEEMSRRRRRQADSRRANYGYYHSRFTVYEVAVCFKNKLLLIIRKT